MFARTFFSGDKRAGFFATGAIVPWKKRARERKDQGAKGPGSELARVLLADSLL